VVLTPTIWIRCPFPRLSRLRHPPVQSHPGAPFFIEVHASLDILNLSHQTTFSPITTSSSQLGTVRYPSSVMSQHQTSQDHYPSHVLSSDRPHHGLDPKLLAVSFPRDCLDRFISIASINTAQNRETCGLLLGKDKGRRYVVTTLLIPKQHSTSDTCAMDEEELVTRFTEERSLITLGWVCRHLRWWIRVQYSSGHYC
jgi:hypothetical protein